MRVLSDAFGLMRVVNLVDRQDRYREASRQLAALGMQFEPGRVEVYPAVRPTELCGFPSLGAHGCFLSHLAILKDALARKVESVLIMEDDCEVLPPDADALLRLAGELQRQPWGFVYLGHVVPLANTSQAVFEEFNGPVQTTHLYGVHGSALAPLVDYLEACLTRPEGDPVGGPMHVDGALTMFRAAHPELRTLLAAPSLARQRSSRSDVTFRSFERLPVVMQAMSAARSLKRALRK